MKPENLETLQLLIDLVRPAESAINAKRMSDDPEMSFPELDELYRILDSVHTTLARMIRVEGGAK